MPNSNALKSPNSFHELPRRDLAAPIICLKFQYFPSFRFKFQNLLLTELFSIFFSCASDILK